MLLVITLTETAEIGTAREAKKKLVGAASDILNCLVFGENMKG